MPSHDEFTRARLKAIETAGQSPLEYLASIYGDTQEDPARRLTAAIAAAPYAHPKLKQLEINITPDARRPEEIEGEVIDVVAELDRRGIARTAGRLVTRADPGAQPEQRRQFVSPDGSAAS